MFVKPSPRSSVMALSKLNGFTTTGTSSISNGLFLMEKLGVHVRHLPRVCEGTHVIMFTYFL